MLIDTHAHFYDEWLLPEADAAVSRALQAGVGIMLQADIDRRERPAMWEVGRRHPGVLYQMLGLYPGSVKEDWQEEMDEVYRLAREGGVVAIGEIGLDYHEGLAFRKQQMEAFRLQLELASALDLPVNIHMRDAWEDFFTVLEDCRPLHLRGNLHCFTASYEVFERAQRSASLSVGIGGVVTFKNAGLPKTLERILLETDAPYLAPTPHRGERNESAFLPLIAAKVAEVKGLSFAQVEEITTANAAKLFAL